MVDSLTNEPIQVRTDGYAGPYIMVQLDQLDQVKKLLDEADIRYSVDDDAISFNNKPFTAVVNLAHDADISAVQSLISDSTDTKRSRKRRPRSGPHR